MSNRKKKMVPTEEQLIQTLLHLYRSNRVAVVEVRNGALKPYTIVEYVDKMAEILCR
jgi:hypothetical protein